MKNTLLIFVSVIMVAFSSPVRAQAFDGWEDVKNFYSLSFHDGDKIGVLYTRMYGLNDIFSAGAMVGMVFDNRYGELLENPDHLEAALLFRVNSAYLSNSAKFNLHLNLSAGLFRVSTIAGATYMWSEKSGIDFFINVPLVNKSILKTFNEYTNVTTRSGFAKSYAGVGLVINVL